MSETVIVAIVLSLVFIVGLLIFAGVLGKIIERAVYDAIAKTKSDEEYERSENTDDQETRKYIDRIEKNK